MKYYDVTVVYPGKNAIIHQHMTLKAINDESLINLALSKCPEANGKKEHVLFFKLSKKDIQKRIKSLNENALYLESLIKE